MSTRAAIARRAETGAGFNGRYHHWDGYPGGLGKTLYDLWNGHFKHDTEAMLKFLLDDHPAGWSTIVDKDFNLPVGYDEQGPNCYCHGARSEKRSTITEKNASGCGVEWVYVVKGINMTILSSYCDPNGKHAGAKMIGAFGMGDPKAIWKAVAEVDLSGTEPDWEKIGEEV